jgi:hypothetical protein
MLKDAKSSVLGKTLEHLQIWEKSMESPMENILSFPNMSIDFTTRCLELSQKWRTAASSWRQ